MSQHTPGPWTVPHFACEDAVCTCPYVLSQHQWGMGAIASVHYQGEDPKDKYDCENEPLEIAKANARLIAAAPDLLAALEAVDQWEGSLILDASAWVDGLPRFTQPMLNQWMEAQKLRVAALGKVREG